MFTSWLSVYQRLIESNACKPGWRTCLQLRRTIIAAIRLFETCPLAEVYEDTLDVAAGRPIRIERLLRSTDTIETSPNILNRRDTLSC